MIYNVEELSGLLQLGLASSSVCISGCTAAFKRQWDEAAFLRLEFRGNSNRRALLQPGLASQELNPQEGLGSGRRWKS